MTYLERLYLFEGQPQKPNGSVSHCPWLGYLRAPGWGFLGVWKVFSETHLWRGRDRRLQSNKGQFGGERKERSTCRSGTPGPFFA